MGIFMGYVSLPEGIACCFLGDENKPNINIMDPDGQISAYMQAWIVPDNTVPIFGEQLL